MMIYETTTTKALSDRELAEAIVDDRIARGQFSDDDRDWLLERELRETRESLVSGFNAIERWNDDDSNDDDNANDSDSDNDNANDNANDSDNDNANDSDNDNANDSDNSNETDENDDFMLDDIEHEESHGPLFDGNLWKLLGEFEWQYDADAIADMITVYDPMTFKTYYKRDDDMPDLEELDDLCILAPVADSIGHILNWYQRNSEIDVLDVDYEQVLDALTDETDGVRVWKPLSGLQVEDIIYDLALVTSDNMGTMAADDIYDGHIDEMWDVLSWAGITLLWIDYDREDEILRKIWFALTTNHNSFPEWKHITRSQVADIVDDVLA